jgi:flagellar L-ring protein precursor FlgH
MKQIALIALVAVIAVAALNACGGPVSQQPTPSANHEAALRNPPVELYPKPAAKTEGSLFSDDVKADFFTDVKAVNVGDIVTINIVETSKASKDAKTDLERNNEVDAGIKALLGFETYNHPLVQELAPEFNLGTGISAAYESKFKGKGKTTRNESMTAQISARVIQVLPNGNLVIRGSREITVNYEKQYIIVQGVVRPEDISPENTVLSTYIADAKIDYTGKGDLSRQQRQGWLSRLIDVIWPF